MKKTVMLLLAVSMLFTLSATAFAHGGGLDQNGGHWDHSTNTYHYHRGPRY